MSIFYILASIAFFAQADKRISPVSVCVPGGSVKNIDAFEGAVPGIALSTIFARFWGVLVRDVFTERTKPISVRLLSN